GTDGWNIGNAPVTLVSAQYAATNPSVSSYAVPLSGSFASSGKKNQPQQIQPFSFSTSALDHQDLVLQTQGEGPQTISRIFKIKPGTHAVKVRYRFITSEIPGGFFGSQYNDYFSVSIRSALQGTIAYESNSMNGMGLAAFDANGATDWREITLS